MGCEKSYYARKQPSTQSRPRKALWRLVRLSPHRRKERQRGASCAHQSGRVRAAVCSYSAKSADGCPACRPSRFAPSPPDHLATFRSPGSRNVDQHAHERSARGRGEQISTVPNRSEITIGLAGWRGWTFWTNVRPCWRRRRFVVFARGFRSFPDKCPQMSGMSARTDTDTPHRGCPVLSVRAGVLSVRSVCRWRGRTV
jgi:hypothetical protein